MCHNHVKYAECHNAECHCADCFGTVEDVSPSFDENFVTKFIKLMLTFSQLSQTNVKLILSLCADFFSSLGDCSGYYISLNVSYNTMFKEIC